MDIIKYNNWMENDEYNKEIEALILDTISKDSIIKLNITKSSIRKHFHKFAEKNNLFHVSYCDKEREFEKSISYWCKDCEMWAEPPFQNYRACCGDGSCGDFMIECGISYGLEDCDCILANEDGPYFIPRETKQTNNIIAITNNIELIKDIFDKMKIKKPLEWIKKREAKF